MTKYLRILIWYLILNFSAASHAMGQNVHKISDLINFNILNENYQLDVGTLRSVAIDITKFGAFPDDGKDDTDAIQSAILSNNVLFFPSGEYAINKSILLQRITNLTLLGDNAIIKQTTAKNTDVFLLRNCDGVLIDGFSFIGCSAEADNNVVAIRFDDKFSSKQIAVQNCTISGQNSKSGFNTGVDIRNAENVLIKNNDFLSLIGNTSGNGYGVHIGNSSRVVAYKNKFLGSLGKGRHAVYLSTGTRSAKVEGNIIKKFDRESIFFNCYSYQEWNENNIVIGNEIYAGAGLKQGLVSQIGIYGKSRNNQIVNNKLYYSENCGIVINGSSGEKFDISNIGNGNTISGNIITYPAAQGIYISGAKNLRVENNTIINAGANYVEGWGSSSIYVGPNVFNLNLPTSENIFFKGNKLYGGGISRSGIFIDTNRKNLIPRQIKISTDNFSVDMRTNNNEYNGAKVQIIK